MKSIRVCFTGHRPNKLGGWDEDNPTKYKACQALNEQIKSLINQYDKVTFITGMALGVDMWAAVEVLKEKVYNPDKVSLIAAVPHVGQQNKWSTKQQYRWLKIFRCADHATFIDEEEYAPWKMLRRNKWMVDNSDLVIAVYNGEESGGTAHCVKYACKKNKDVINLWDKINAKI